MFGVGFGFRRLGVRKGVDPRIKSGGDEKERVVADFEWPITAEHSFYELCRR